MTRTQKVILLLATVTLLLSLKESPFAIATFWILVVTTAFSIAKCGYPYFRRWMANRVLIVSYSDGLASVATSKVKVIHLGKQDIFLRLQMKSPKYISRADFYFNRSRNQEGLVASSVISFEHVIVDNSQGLPYESNLWPNESINTASKGRMLILNPLESFRGMRFSPLLLQLMPRCPGADAYTWKHTMRPAR